MDLKRPNKLRLSGKSGAEETPQSGGDAGLPAGFPVNEVAELVADLIESTALVSPDRLAAVRGRVKQGGSFSQAIIDEGVATSEGLARTLGSRDQRRLRTGDDERRAVGHEGTVPGPRVGAGPAHHPRPGVTTTGACQRRRRRRT